MERSLLLLLLLCGVAVLADGQHHERHHAVEPEGGVAAGPHPPDPDTKTLPMTDAGATRPAPLPALNELDASADPDLLLEPDSELSSSSSSSSDDASESASAEKASSEAEKAAAEVKTDPGEQKAHHDDDDAASEAEKTHGGAKPIGALRAPPPGKPLGEPLGQPNGPADPVEADKVPDVDSRPLPPHAPAPSLTAAPADKSEADAPSDASSASASSSTEADEQLFEAARPAAPEEAAPALTADVEGDDAVDDPEQDAGVEEDASSTESTVSDSFSAPVLMLGLLLLRGAVR